MLMSKLIAVASAVALAGVVAATPPIEDRVEHVYANSNGVKIHCAVLGPADGPLVVMLHGFPDYWYTWRHQMEELAKDHRVVAVDLRGYNKSDKPEGVEQYDMRLLIGDVAAVIGHFGRERAIVVGHDWGGAIAWSVAMYAPHLVEKLIVCNLPHPNGIARELRENPQQHSNSQYARDFQAPDAHEKLTAEGLAGWVTDEDARAKYVEAFERSSFEAMLNYYKRNFPRTPAPSSEKDENASSDTAPPPAPPVVKVKAPVLLIHGLEDKALLASGLNDTWEWLESDLNIVTIPGAGHFVQQDAADLVTRTMRAWLDR